MAPLTHEELLARVAALRQKRALEGLNKTMESAPPKEKEEISPKKNEETVQGSEEKKKNDVPLQEKKKLGDRFKPVFKPAKQDECARPSFILLLAALPPPFTMQKN